MFRAILWSQWKWSWMVVLTATLAAFTIPILSVQSAGSSLQAGYGWEFLSHMSEYSVCYSILAAALGLLLAVLAWGSDHRGRHVYALALPVPRWRYVLMRFQAGSVLMLAPIVALGVSATLSVLAIDLPPGLHPYPVALTLRFALAALVAYAIFFSISSATPKTAGYVLAIILGLVLSAALIDAAGFDGSIVEWAVTSLFRWPGVFEVFSGRWMLIDV